MNINYKIMQLLLQKGLEFNLKPARLIFLKKPMESEKMRIDNCLRQSEEGGKLTGDQVRDLVSYARRYRERGDIQEKTRDRLKRIFDLLNQRIPEDEGKIREEKREVLGEGETFFIKYDSKFFDMIPKLDPRKQESEFAKRAILLKESDLRLGQIINVFAKSPDSSGRMTASGVITFLGQRDDNTTVEVTYHNGKRVSFFANKFKIYSAAK